MTRPLSREQLVDHYRTEWMCERATAETVACRPRPWGCGAPAGTTCTNQHTRRPLERAPAHLCRITDAAAAARNRPAVAA